MPTAFPTIVASPLVGLRGELGGELTPDAWDAGDHPDDDIWGEGDGDGGGETLYEVLGSAGCGGDGTDSGDRAFAACFVVGVDGTSTPFPIDVGACIAMTGELEGVGWRCRCFSFSASSTATGIEIGSGTDVYARGLIVAALEVDDAELELDGPADVFVPVTIFSLGSSR